MAVKTRIKKTIAIKRFPDGELTVLSQSYAVDLCGRVNSNSNLTNKYMKK
jgi:hypothetical protein